MQDLLEIYLKWTISGGCNLGVLEDCLICEEVAYGCSGIMAALYITAVGVSTLYVEYFG